MNAAAAVQRRAWWLLAAVNIGNAVVLWYFMDRYWYPTDDGLYAHVAERLLAGEVLHRDIQDIHPGYIHFLHLLAFRLFGLDLLSLRYPLVLAALIEACLVFLLLRRRSEVLAVVGSIAATSLGLVQFMSPTANWYALPLCIALVVWLVSRPSPDPWRVPVAGFLLGVLTLFRHLSGVWAAMALLTVLLLEESRDRPRDRSALARSVLTIMLAALVVYVLTNRETEIGGIVLIAAWPIAVLIWMLRYVRAGNRETAHLLVRLGAGVAVPALPLIAYHLFHGSLDLWFRDIVLSAARETGLHFFGNGWYGILPVAGAAQAVGSVDPLLIANGWYWTVLPLLWAVNGALVLKALMRGDDLAQLTPGIAAVFFAMVSLYLEGPLYLYYSIGLTLVSLLWLAASGNHARRIFWGVTATGLALVALVCHAGQTRHRMPLEILQGKRFPLADTRSSQLERCSLRLDPVDYETYGHLVSLIEAETPPDGAILALPNNSELYFLSSRRNPSRFYNAALGVQTSNDFDTLLDALAVDPPSVVTFSPADKYNTPLILRVMDHVRTGYERLDVIGGVELYRRRASGIRGETGQARP